MTLGKQLKQYICKLYQLSVDETWECEVIDEVADHILPDHYLQGALSRRLLNTYTYYSDTLHMKQIYPFVLYEAHCLIAVGFLDKDQMKFIYLFDTKQVIIDQLYLIKGDEER